MAFSEGTTFQLKVTNNGTNSTYFAVLDIEPNGRINPVVPNANVNPPVTATDCRLEPHASKVLDPVFIIYPPYGLETYKLLAGPSPIDTEPIITRVITRGPGMNPLELLLDDTFSTRGTGTVGITSNPNAGASRNIIFRIVPK